MNLTPKQRASINPSFIIHSSDVQCLEEGINTNVQTGALTIEVNGHEVQYPGIAVAKEDGIDFYAWKQKGGKLQLMENVLGFTAIVVSKK